MPVPTDNRPHRTPGQIRLGTIAVVCAALLITGCHHMMKPKAPELFTEIYITSTPTTAEIYSAYDGQYLGLTPEALKFSRSSYPYPTDHLSILVLKDSCPPTVHRFLVTRWANTPEDATLSTNNIHVPLAFTDNDCLTN